MGCPFLFLSALVMEKETVMAKGMATASTQPLSLLVRFADQVVHFHQPYVPRDQ
jgi:hypothetical protein